MDTQSRVNAAAGANRMAGAILRNLLAGAKLILLQRVRREAFAASADAFAALVALNLVLLLALDFANVGTAGEFNVAEFPRALLFVPLTLAFGLFVERSGGTPGTMLVLSVALAAAGTVLTAVFGLLGVLLHYQTLYLPSQAQWDALHYGGLACWLAVVTAATCRLAPSGLGRDLVHALAGVALLVAPAWWHPQSQLWMLAEDRAAAARARAGALALVDEQGFYAQQEALRRALEALEPERPGIADLYVVAAALYAREDVFMKEVRGIVDLFRSAFDAEGRTLALINNPGTVEGYPLASLTSLTLVLRHIGSLMNVEEDVLVLYVSSHGSDKHELSVDFPPLRLAPIGPGALKQALAESGIKWRIVVVSACYSGGFIESLRDDYTMVITASSASRQSFGCGNDSESTYLARALFDEALRNSRSFEAAFQQAREAIARRERARGFEPSEPQMVVGAAMREKLKQVEARLQILER